MTSHLIDTHAHLDALVHDDLPSILRRAEEAGVRRVVSVGSSLGSSREAVRLAAEYSCVLAAVGIHPHDCREWPEAESELRALSQMPGVVAIGEVGLDYHYEDTDEAAQDKAFRGQLGIAAESGLPVMIHCRDAYDEVAEIVSERRDELKGVIIHCFSGTVEHARLFLELGCHISFAGQVTFKNRGPLEEVVRATPKERLLLETDCPYLAPHPKRGTPNEPANVALTAQAVADIKQMSFTELVTATTEAAETLLGLI